MKESRSEKYGRNLAYWLLYTIATIPQNQRDFYKSKLIDELKKYSFERRKKGAPRNGGCHHELQDIDACIITDPVHLARLVKEGIHLMYQKETARRAVNGLLKKLE